MPKVPAGSGQAAPLSIPPDQEVYLAMAAANMDKMGRLFEPEKDPTQKPLAQPIGPTGRERIGADGKVSGF